MRRKEWRVSDAKRMLDKYVIDPPININNNAREMIECYGELSPESQNEIAMIVYRIDIQNGKGFGVLSALELIGALIKAGKL